MQAWPSPPLGAAVDQRRNGIEFWLNDFKDRNTERNVAFDDLYEETYAPRVRVTRLPAHVSNATLQHPLRGRIHLQAEWLKAVVRVCCAVNATLPRTATVSAQRPTWAEPR